VCPQAGRPDPPNDWACPATGLDPFRAEPRPPWGWTLQGLAPLGDLKFEAPAVRGDSLGMVLDTLGQPDLGCMQFPERQEGVPEEFFPLRLDCLVSRTFGNL